MGTNSKSPFLGRARVRHLELRRQLLTTPTYLEDTPAGTAEFDFELLAYSLAEFFVQPSRGARVLGLHGPWGSGKTTLMHAVRRELERSAGQTVPVFVEFNAWKFRQREALWRALILQVVGELRKLEPNSQELDELEHSLYRALAVQEKGPWTVNWSTLITELAGIGLTFLHLDFVARALTGSRIWIARLFGSGKKSDTGGIIDEDRIKALAGVLQRTTVERQIEQVQSIEQFLDRFRRLVDRIAARGRPIYVLIDDLDRCLPEEALDVFESIKLFLDSPNCGFIVALDRDVIRKGLSIRYQSTGPLASGALIDPDEYIEKTISLSFDLPRLSRMDVLAIVDSVQLPIQLSESDRTLLLTGLGVNPRRAKRFANTLVLQARLAALAAGQGRQVPACLLTDGARDDLPLYLKLSLIAYRYSTLFGIAQEDPGILQRLQAIANVYGQERNNNDAARAAKARQTRRESLANEPLLVRTLDDDEEFWRLLGTRPSLLENGDSTVRLMSWFRHEAQLSSQEPANRAGLEERPKP